MIDVLKAGIKNTTIIYKPLVRGTKNNAPSGEFTTTGIFTSQSGRNEFGEVLGVEYKLIINKTNFTPQTGDFFLINGENYKIKSVSLKDNNLDIKPYYKIYLTKNA
jgi:hypothetical protein